MTKSLEIALLQMQVASDKQINIEKAARLAEEAMALRPGMLVLPEFFNCPYDMRRLEELAEYSDGPSVQFLSELARRHQVILVGGTIPEKDGQGSFYNTCFIFGPDGKMLGRHRKVHLFDIDMPGRIRFKESAYLTAGDELTVISHGGLCFAVQICFDIRFPEWSRLAALAGAELLVVPAAFNTTTGPLHWELLMRSRAVDNQFFVAACSPAPHPKLAYQSWGHSLIVDPMGHIVTKAERNETILTASLQLNQVGETRQALPIMANRRDDLYQLCWCGSGQAGDTCSEHRKPKP